MVVGEFTQETDLLVIGGGPGGYTCAFRAAELGVQTVILDDAAMLGGICLREGCVPSKTLLHAASLINSAPGAQEMGIRFGDMVIDLPALRAWKDRSIDRLARGLDALCRRHGVERLIGRAKFENSKSVHVIDGPVPRIKFRRAVVATGSRHVPHPLLPFDGERIIPPTAALSIADIPKRLLIVGGGYQAIELATIYAAIGSAVTLITADDRLLPEADIDLVRPLAKRLASVLEAVHTSTNLARARVNETSVGVIFIGADSTEYAFDRVIIAGAQHGCTAGLGLEHTQAQVDGAGFISVDAHLRSADPRIFAIGDVTGAPLLADKAIAQGRVCGEVLAGWNALYEPRAIPMAAFTDPQIAWCGLTESEATAHGREVEVLTMPWGASGRAVGMGRTDGLTKLICDRDTHLVLGVGIVGANAAELIGEAALAIEMGAVLHDLAATLHPHPTVSELVSEAARQGEGGKP